MEHIDSMKHPTFWYLDPMKRWFNENYLDSLKPWLSETSPYLRTYVKRTSLFPKLIVEPVAIPPALELLAYDALEGRAQKCARDNFLRHPSNKQINVAHLLI